MHRHAHDPVTEMALRVAEGDAHIQQQRCGRCILRSGGPRKRGPCGHPTSPTALIAVSDECTHGGPVPSMPDPRCNAASYGDKQRPAAPRNSWLATEAAF